jgi:hypothetical protein
LISQLVSDDDVTPHLVSTVRDKTVMDAESVFVISVANRGETPISVT